jgi:hypothetical protein
MLFHCGILRRGSLFLYKSPCNLFNGISTYRKSCRLFLILTFLLVFPFSNPVWADLILHVGDATVTEGGSGFFDVSFDKSSGDYSLSAYMIELDISGPSSAVQFTGFGEAPNAIFSGQIPAQTKSRPALPGTIAAANDLLMSGASSILDKSGLLRVNFTAPLGSAGIYTVNVDKSILRTNFTDPNGDFITLPQNNYQAGTITVSAVPEPSALLLLSISGVVGGGYFWRRRV